MPANDGFRIVAISAELESGRDKYKLYVNLYFDDIIIGSLEEDDIEFKVGIEKAYLEVRVTNGGYNIIGPRYQYAKDRSQEVEREVVEKAGGKRFGIEISGKGGFKVEGGSGSENIIRNQIREIRSSGPDIYVSEFTKTSAKWVIEAEDGNKLGYIPLPKFGDEQAMAFVVQTERINRPPAIKVKVEVRGEDYYTYDEKMSIKYRLLSINKRKAIQATLRKYTQEYIGGEKSRSLIFSQEFEDIGV